MTITRALAVCLVALGLAGVSVALGFLYFDWKRQMAADAEISSWNVLQTDQPLTPEERDEILEAWGQTENDWVALAAGTAGIAILGAGLMIALFELPLFRPCTADQSSS